VATAFRPPVKEGRVEHVKQQQKVNHHKRSGFLGLESERWTDVHTYAVTEETRQGSEHSAVVETLVPHSVLLRDRAASSGAQQQQTATELSTTSESSTAVSATERKNEELEQDALLHREHDRFTAYSLADGTYYFSTETHTRRSDGGSQVIRTRESHRMTSEHRVDGPNGEHRQTTVVESAVGEILTVDKAPKQVTWSASNAQIRQEERVEVESEAYVDGRARSVVDGADPGGIPHEQEYARGERRQLLGGEQTHTSTVTVAGATRCILVQSESTITTTSTPFTRDDSGNKLLRDPTVTVVRAVDRPAEGALGLLVQESAIEDLSTGSMVSAPEQRLNPGAERALGAAITTSLDIFLDVISRYRDKNARNVTTAELATAIGNLLVNAGEGYLAGMAGMLARATKQLGDGLPLAMIALTCAEAARLGIDYHDMERHLRFLALLEQGPEPENAQP
jgi:hypothetical protein